MNLDALKSLTKPFEAHAFQCWDGESAVSSETLRSYASSQSGSSATLESAWSRSQSRGQFGGASEVSTENATAKGDVMSKGSALHDTGGCTPCKFFRSRRGCRLGEECKLCHFPHAEMSGSSVRRAVRRRAIEERLQSEAEAMSTQESANESGYERPAALQQQQPIPTSPMPTALTQQLQHQQQQQQQQLSVQQSPQLTQSLRTRTGSSSDGPWLADLGGDTSSMEPAAVSLEALAGSYAGRPTADLHGRMIRKISSSGSTTSQVSLAKMQAIAVAQMQLQQAPMEPAAPPPGLAPPSPFPLEVHSQQQVPAPVVASPAATPSSQGNGATGMAATPLTASGFGSGVFKVLGKWSF
mmetsp:Transcript_13934/g.39827  ORF Transcript_13934/g.39827 Transcript_13934/m.39827 type:complete len:355 (-) Transcript_13934:163-1227(-)